ncbi:MAG: hypothetical protein RL220_1370 [Bacteroidota bacterium]
MRTGYGQVGGKIVFLLLLPCMNSSVIPSSRLPRTGTTIFTIMSQLAAEHGAINLGQGFPGFPVDPALTERVKEAMDQGHNQYAPMPGILSLRELLSAKLRNSYGQVYDPTSEITITAGATQAIFTAITALIKPGDEVILFAPAYDCYAPAVELNGGMVKWITMSYPDYRVQWDDVKAAISPRTKMIVFNTPHNPAGTIWSESDVLQLQDLTRDTEIIVISDEVYEHIVFDGMQHMSCARFPELASRSVLVYSFGKTLHVTGWKMGYVAAPEALMKEFRKVHQYNVFSVNTPAQYAIESYMRNPDTYRGLADFFQRKRDLFLSRITNPVFSFVPSAGSYFQLLQYKGADHLPDVELAKKWTVSYGITSIPLSVFYPDGLDESVLRFCFAKDDDLLIAAADALNKIS